MGSDSGEGYRADGEGPQRRVTLSAYSIAPCVVTNAEFDRVISIRDRPFFHIKQLVFNEDYRIFVTYGALKETFGVVWGGRHHDFETWCVIIPGL